MDANQLRNKFLDFFARKDHAIEESASLVPMDDPSLLWVNSGVATLKKYFDGRQVPSNPRIVNVQKSIRTNDIENVGYTSRHHTFFEMMGNFSIGDYFKDEAIVWAWEFLTSPDWLGLDPKKLYVTIHPEDEEAFEIWHMRVGLEKERIVKLKENYWDIGEGPSGPNTEIFYDRGSFFCDSTDPECFPGGENERYLEVWNLVFSQYNHNPDGSYTPLPKKNIDTGMGLERILSVLEGVTSSYETSLFQPLVQEICKKTGATYHKNTQTDTALHVIADHVRAIVFAMSDGVFPSNDGRGYVLRRLLRRAIRYGFKLGMDKPFLFELTSIVVNEMKSFYPNLPSKENIIAKTIRKEEERFLITLEEGLQKLESLIEKAKQEKNREISGADAFKLYDTYGFPVELTVEYVRDYDVTVNDTEFEGEMRKQRERSRFSRSDSSSMQIQDDILDELQGMSTFVGYERTKGKAIISGIIEEGKWVNSLQAGKKGLVVLTETPFYAESGGQVSDYGSMTTENAVLRIKKVSKGPKGDHIHEVVVEKGAVKKGDEANLQIDESMRRKIAKNHTATHMLHQALRDVLGEHVNQAGSLVTPDTLRFDFSHMEPMTDEEKKRVEGKVNALIFAQVNVSTIETSQDKAKKMGAMALFGEKYQEKVRVVRIGDFSLELCGGTHVKNTSEVGLFKIINESGIGSGIRRIEAITSEAAFSFLNSQMEAVTQIAEDLKCKRQDVPHRIKVLKERMHELERENASLKSLRTKTMVNDLLAQTEDIAGVTVLRVELNDMTMEDLRSLMDELRRELSEGLIVLATAANGKASFVANVSQSFVSKGVHAGKIVKELAAICQGGGGGRADMAQAGGKAPEKISQALIKVEELVRNMYNKA